MSTQTTLGPYKVHPAADIFPLMEGEEFAQLVESIKNDGLIEPIVLSHDGETMIDGRNRYRACLEAKRDPMFYNLGANYDEEKIINFIVAANVHRRHLNVGQRAFISLELLPLFEKLAKARQKEHGGTAPGKSLPDNLPEVSRRDLEAREQAGKVTKVSGKSVQHAKKVAQSPDLASRVKAGEMSLDSAFKQTPGVSTRQGKDRAAAFADRDGAGAAGNEA